MDPEVMARNEKRRAENKVKRPRRTHAEQEADLKAKLEALGLKRDKATRKEVAILIDQIGAVLLSGGFVPQEDKMRALLTTLEDWLSKPGEEGK